MLISGRSTVPTVIFLHGFLGSSADWQPLARRLQAAWRCVLVDLPGHGRAHFPEHPELYSCAGATQAVLATADRPAHLVGYSLGGRLALQLALQHPERWRSLTLISASAGLPLAAERSARRRADDALAADLEQNGLTAFLKKWYGQKLFGNLRRKPALFDRLVRRRRKNRAEELARVSHGCSVGRQPALWHRLAELRLPVLLLAGAEDAKYVRLMRRMQRLIPAAQLVVVEKAGHAVIEEQPVRAAQVLKHFLQSTANNSGRNET